MLNKFNNLNSKEWLPFQKSWFKFDGKEKLYLNNIRFFTKIEKKINGVFYYGNSFEIVKNICNELGLAVTNNIYRHDGEIQFALIDLLDDITDAIELDEYKTIQYRTMKIIQATYDKMIERRFLAVLVPNIRNKNTYYPFAWELANKISMVYSLKDEKICCLDNHENTNLDKTYFATTKGIFYCLYFRKDEKSSGVYNEQNFLYFKNNTQEKSSWPFKGLIPSWFILKPQPRKKDEILHPAKYPEDLVEMFVNEFTREGDNVFDPMSGTGSTQLAALKLKRNGYGTELSEFFSKIAYSRCQEFLEPKQMHLFPTIKKQTFKIINKDARLIKKDDFPEIDYLITSPPYWDMLNMKGAENQAKRLEKGLKTSYSDDCDDLGNIANYEEFIAELVSVYFYIIDTLLKPGAYLTIIVKNIKKKGVNYPFAWDLTKKLQEKLILLPEAFWCQDDITVAPYGYGNTWVSNTFHQYCLSFQKPNKGANNL
ncbi:MAG TPA: DNA methyltransferase [Candidatus Paceibacterota bacterium]|nr:DNA methyltransferase [Candidatus Paceibacterota bacterium]